jgi:NAD(P)-dependent dehydrogenase (short-subunit alcohol dehydrogenase family)
MTGAFTGKVVLITGGGTGIGAATARRFAAAGAGVVVTGRRDGPLRAIAEEVGAVAVVGDTGDPAHCAAAVATAIDRFGGLDVVVPNAAVEAFGSVTEIGLDDWQAALRTNIDGVMFIARAAIPALKQRGGGAIVIVSSVLGHNAAPHFSAYLTSKAAVIGLTRSMAMDFGPDRIRVNAVCPGWVRTELAERTIQVVADERGVPLDEMIRRMVQFYPLRRMAEPDEIATCIEFLASPGASFVTGTTLNADGGGMTVNSGTLEFPV